MGPGRGIYNYVQMHRSALYIGALAMRIKGLDRRGLYSLHNLHITRTPFFPESLWKLSTPRICEFKQCFPGSSVVCRRGQAGAHHSRRREQVVFVGDITYDVISPNVTNLPPTYMTHLCKIILEETIFINRLTRSSHLVILI